MHSKIIEISKTPIERDEYMTESCFAPEEYDHVADYLQNVPQSAEDKIIARIDDFGIFERNGRELTLLDLREFMKEWKSKIQEKADCIDFNDSLALYSLKEVIKETHHYSSMLFYYGEEFMTLGEFAHWMHCFQNPGDKFYIGGVLDYHW